MSLQDLETPAAVIDMARMDANIARMQAQVSGLGAALRPHVKTSKSLAVTARQVAAGARGLTVSTLKEAEQFLAAGHRDILYAVGIAPGKLDRALALRRQGCDLTLLVDSVEAARAAAAAARAAGDALPVMIEIDCDGHRSGVPPESETLLAVGRALEDGGARLAGVLTHAGSSYELDTPDALRALAEQERALSVRAAARLRAAGLPCPAVSIGSTPTALASADLTGVTEVRAGVYVFFDLVMANVGVCRPADVALSVLTTVTGHQPDKGWVIVDAGWMAMSRDRGTQRQKTDWGYGAVCDLDGTPLPGCRFSAANQEHGIIAVTPPADAASQFPIGRRLRILPNHACATGAQFPAYAALAPDGRVETWDRFYGW